MGNQSSPFYLQEKQMSKFQQCIDTFRINIYIGAEQVIQTHLLMISAQ